jgi:hypothetical protein
MGYRCPNCHKDFGLGENSKNELYKHFQENPECASEAYVYTELWEKSVKLNKAPLKTTKRCFNKISDKHIWVKSNVISNKDGSDIMVCKRCGLKAKRYGSSFEFDMRSIYKIENCID